jgi:hypothetical protein
MKHSLPALLALTCVLCLSAFARPSTAEPKELPPLVSYDDDLSTRVETLEAEVKDLKLTVKKQEALFTQAVKYLENQAASGAALSSALSKSESLGFTKGINFGSRELMLSAFQAHCKSLQKDVPRLPNAAAAVAKKRR